MTTTIAAVIAGLFIARFAALVISDILSVSADTKETQKIRRQIQAREIYRISRGWR